MCCIVCCHSQQFNSVFSYCFLWKLIYMECVHVTLHIDMRSTVTMKCEASIHITLDKTGAFVDYINLESTLQY
jgi:hypothetical protein